MPGGTRVGRGTRAEHYSQGGGGPGLEQRSNVARVCSPEESKLRSGTHSNGGQYPNTISIQKAWIGDGEVLPSQISREETHTAMLKYMHTRFSDSMVGQH